MHSINIYIYMIQYIGQLFGASVTMSIIWCFSDYVTTAYEAYFQMKLPEQPANKYFGSLAE